MWFKTTGKYLVCFLQGGSRGLCSKFLGQEKNLFVSRNGLKTNRVGRSLNLFFFALFFWSKLWVLCMFYVDWEFGGQKKLEGRDFFE